MTVGPDPFDKELDRRYEGRLRWLHWHGRVILLLERVTIHGWRTALWTLFFASLWIFAIPQSLGDLASAAAFITFIAGLCYFYHVDLRRIRWPRAIDIERRIESDSGVAHHPLMTTGDHLANPNSENTRALWHAARARAFAEINKLKPLSWRPLAAIHDRYALRFGLLMVFGLGILLAGPDWKIRLWSGLTPFSFSWGASTLEPVRLVITPPTYTGLPQINVIGERERGLDVPAGSVIKALVHSPLGFISPPKMTLGERTYSFTADAEKDYGLEIMAPPGGPTLSIHQMMMPKGRWDYRYITDQPPTITIKDVPDILPEGSLRFPLTLSDDYGVKSITLRMDLKNKLDAPPIGRVFSETRPVSSPRGQEIDMTQVYDLSAHPWAGREVIITLSTEDALRQKASAAPLKLMLPIREFTNPLSREIIALRSQLLKDPVNDYEIIQNKLEFMIAEPDRYNRDIVVLLALRSASSRLFWAGPSIATAESVVALLWDTALRIEDGNFSLARRSLRDAHKELSEALQDPYTSDAEIDRLMQKMRQAMAQYFSEMQQQIARSMASGKQPMMLPPEMFADLLSPEKLAAMLADMENQILAGDRNTAQKMLSQMQRMMDSFNPAGQEIPQPMQDMMKAGAQLQEIIARQQSLLDQVLADLNAGASEKHEFQELQRSFGTTLPADAKTLREWKIDSMPPPPTNPASSLQKANALSERGMTLSKEQESIRLLLGELILSAGSAMGKVPESLQKAESEMRQSLSALLESDFIVSRGHQEQALKYLQETKEQMSEQMAEQLKNMMGMALGGGMRLDPLGRPMRPDGQGLPGSESVTIPDEAQRKQAQDIMRLLQERAGQFHRPASELEYYRRLLKQF
jgi:uncharacterized protein (TIGR02302 family)